MIKAPSNISRGNNSKSQEWILTKWSFYDMVLSMFSPFFETLNPKRLGFRV